MGEIPGVGPFIAAHQGGRLEIPQAIQAGNPQHPGHSRAGDLQRRADPPGDRRVCRSASIWAATTAARRLGWRCGRDDRSSNVRSPARHRASHLTTVRTLTPAASAAWRGVHRCSRRCSTKKRCIIGVSSHYDGVSFGSASRTWVRCGIPPTFQGLRMNNVFCTSGLQAKGRSRCGIRVILTVRNRTGRWHAVVPPHNHSPARHRPLG